MIYFADGEGKILNAVQERIFQGSVGGYRLRLVSPFAETAWVTASFSLPNGNSCAPVFLTADSALSGLTDRAGRGLVARSAAVQPEVFNEYGLVKVQFYVRYNGAEGMEKLALEPVFFTVERGVRENLPESSSDEVFDRLISAMSAVDSNVRDRLTVLDGLEEQVRNFASVMTEYYTRAETDEKVLEMSGKMEDAVEEINARIPETVNAAVETIAGERHYTKAETDVKIAGSETKTQAQVAEVGAQARRELTATVAAVNADLGEVRAQAQTNAQNVARIEEQIANLGQQAGANAGIVMVPISYWQNGVAQVTSADGAILDKVTADSIVTVTPLEENAIEFIRNHIRVTAQTEGGLTFECDEAPYRAMRAVVTVG